MKSIRLYALLGLVAILGAIGLNVAPTLAQNVNLNGAFYRLGGLGLGVAPTGVTGALNVSGVGVSAPASTVITSAATIAPTTRINHVSGTAAIATITVPATCTVTCELILIPDGAFTTVQTGNIRIASTAVIDKALIAVWDGSGWNLSY